MSIQIKSIAILLVTLLLGAIGGASVTSMIVRERLEYIRSFSQVDGFVARFEEFIGPVSDEQREQIEPLLEAAGQDVNVMFGEFGQDFRSTVDQLEEDLSVYLTDEQIERLKARRVEARHRYIGHDSILEQGGVSRGEPANGSQQYREE